MSNKVTVLVNKERHTLYGRDALSFCAWWDSGPRHDAKGKEVKVEFYQKTEPGSIGSTFAVLHGGARGGFRRTALVVKKHD